MKPKSPLLTRSLLSLLGGLLFCSSWLHGGAPSRRPMLETALLREAREASRAGRSREPAAAQRQRERLEDTARLAFATLNPRGVSDADRTRLKRVWGPEVGRMLDLIR